MPLPRLLLLTTAAALALGAGPASAATLPAPALSGPADDESVSALPPFEWKKVKRASTYELQVSADEGFGSLVTGGAIRTANTAGTLLKSLPDGTYSWRVRGVSAKNKAGRWSPVRTVRKRWAAQPRLETPTGAAAVTYPTTPVVLRWSPVAGAAKYIVSVASDPSLAQSVIGTRTLETSGTVYALQNALAPGRYYWAVQPVDVQGHRGARSDVGSFIWHWPSTTALDDPTELRGDARVSNPALSDPRLSWAPVAGASGYEVEINYFDDFSPGSKVCCAGTSIDTTISPRDLLPNNTYYWRVRALDVNGNPDQWNTGKPFVKTFDTLAPTVPNLRLRDNEADPFRDRGSLDGLPKVQHPIVTWDPVPGASGYEIQFAPQEGTVQKFCDWTGSRVARTPHTAWSQVVKPSVNPPGPSSWANKLLRSQQADALAAGAAYCVRVMAIADFAYAARADEVTSEWTYIDNRPGAPPSHVSTDSNAAAFVLEAPEQMPVLDPARDPRMDASDYISPAVGQVNAATPTLRWHPVPGARSYWVVLARDAEFTNVIEVAFTHVPQHAPRTTLRDESTHYHWVVIPSPSPGGGDVPTGVMHNNAREFDKRSSGPQLIEPASGTTVPGQPRFHWSGVAGARTYVVQVSTDPTFKDSSQELDEVKTSSTGYTPIKTYPVDRALYWRVHGVAVGSDGDVHLSHSAVGRFQRRLPVPLPSPSNPLGGSTIQAFTWSPVPGAVEYDIHVDQADGSRRDFETRGTAFAPTTHYGTGVWRWQVRAVFPGGSHGAYSDPLPYTRFIPAPEAARADRTRHRVLLRWNPVVMAARYKVEVSTGTSFADTVESVRTDLTSWAPDLNRREYRSGGTLHWRVGALDEGNAAGAFTNGVITLRRKLVVTSSSRLRRRTRQTIALTVNDLGGKSIRGARVRLSGAGVRSAKRSDRRGLATFTVRPRRRGRIAVTVAKKGYEAGRTTLRVR